MNAVLAWIKASLTTSETKLLLIIGLWALAHRIFPGVPVELPPIDLSSAGLGSISPSLGTLGVYVIGRVVVKAASPGQFPFQPDPVKEGQ